VTTGAQRVCPLSPGLLVSDATLAELVAGLLPHKRGDVQARLDHLRASLRAPLEEDGRP
jgi:hypothetical protein